MDNTGESPPNNITRVMVTIVALAIIIITALTITAILAGPPTV
ncbi:MAG: hypothetical protein AAF485_13195 [Chloroflexota bacterium]